VKYRRALLAYLSFADTLEITLVAIALAINSLSQIFGN
jgi:hypothetical protein